MEKGAAARPGRKKGAGQEEELGGTGETRSANGAGSEGKRDLQKGFAEDPERIHDTGEKQTPVGD